MSDKATTLVARLLKDLNSDIYIIGESYTGDCDSGMTASATTIVSADLKGFGDDYFNNGWVMVVLHNVNSDGNAPEGEIKDITDYVSVNGTFTTAAFSANVEENDVVLVSRRENFVIDEYTLDSDPASGSLASFIASGGTALGTQLAASKSIIDAIGHTGAARLDSGLDGLIADGLINGTGTVLPANKSVYDIIGTEYVDAGGNPDVDTIRDHLVAGLLNGTGTALPTNKSLYDVMVLDRMSGTESTGTHSHANDTLEQTVVELTGTTRRRIESIWLDFSALTQDMIIKVYHKIDGTNYRQYDEYKWVTTDEDGVHIAGVTVNNDWKVTLTSVALEGAIRSVPYNIIITPME